jgi:tellurite resistance protein TerA
MVAAGGKRRGEGQAQGPGYKPDDLEQETPGVATVAAPEPAETPAPPVAAPPPPVSAPAPPTSAPPPGF